MNTALWIVAWLLAVVYLAAGLFKIFLPKDKQQQMPPKLTPAVKTLGVLELLGAIGVVAPQATGIAQPLTPAAAVGLAVVQIGAIVVHARRRDYATLPINAVLLAAAIFLAVGRI
jgi:hypothetical protein